MREICQQRGVGTEQKINLKLGNLIESKYLLFISQEFNLLTHGDHESTPKTYIS